LPPKETNYLGKTPLDSWVKLHSTRVADAVLVLPILEYGSASLEPTGRETSKSFISENEFEALKQVLSHRWLKGRILCQPDNPVKIFFFTNCLNPE
jgi:hypothetical protein